MIKDSTNCPPYIRSYENCLPFFARQKNCHLLTSRRFGCYLWWHFPYLERSLQISNKRFPIWPCCLGIFVFMCFCFGAVKLFFCVLMFECLCLSGIECCTPCRARMSLTADNCFALLHSPLHPPPFMMMLHFLYIIFIYFLYTLISIMIFPYFLFIIQKLC